MQYAVPTITCKRLAERPAGSLDPQSPATMCSDQQKFLVDAAKVDSSEIRSVTTGFNKATYGGWYLTVQLSPAGQMAFTALTRTLAGTFRISV
jgi:hypothetical protein